MYGLGVSEEGELRGQLANPGSPGRVAIKWSVCVSVTALVSVHRHDNYLLALSWLVRFNERLLI